MSNPISLSSILTERNCVCAEFAGRSIQKSTWARAYYRSQRDLRKDHHTAVRSLAFKWMRVLYCMPAGETVNPTTRPPMLAVWKNAIPHWPS